MVGFLTSYRYVSEQVWPSVQIGRSGEEAFQVCGGYKMMKKLRKWNDGEDGCEEQEGEEEEIGEVLYV